MAYMLPFSMQDCYDYSGNRVVDACLHVLQGGSDSVAPAYSDSGLGTRYPSPIPMRRGGVWPQIYLPPGAYRLRITDPYNYIYDEIQGLVIDELTIGGGGGGDVDDKRLAQTGDLKDRHGVGTHPGWVRANGRTIGSAASSASERANDDCHNLFVFLWTQDANLAVSGGRGANAESDWAGAKTIALPDMRGRARVSLDDLGNTAAGRLSGGLFTFGNATTFGSYGGEASHTQTLAEMATHSHPVSATMDAQGSHAHTGSTSTDGEHFHGVQYLLQAGYRPTTDLPVGAVQSVGAGGNGLGYTGNAGGHFHAIQTDVQGLHAHNIAVSVTSQGGGAAMNWLPPFILTSVYLKL